MVPRKFNIVDFGGFDLAEQYGEALPGIYDKVVDAHWNCVYIMCFGLKFGGFDIAPQYMTPEMFSDHIMMNGIISIDQNDVITVPGIEPPPVPPVVQSLIAVENRIYTAPEGIDGFNPVNVQVPSVTQLLTVTENGVYEAPEEVDGFNPVNVQVPAQMNPDFLSYVMDYSTCSYQGGAEYSGSIYNNTSMISALHLTLLGDFSQGATTGTLADSVENYSAVILQGVYQKNRTSQYNTSILYYGPSLSNQYWAGMKDKNYSYTCYVTFTSPTQVTLAGNRQVIIYGMR